MHDIRAVRADPAAFDAAMARRGLAPVADGLVALDERRRGAIAGVQERQTRRNALAREIGQGKRTGANTAGLEAEASSLRDAMEQQEAESAALDTEIRNRLGELPNILDPSVPDGRDETDNIVIAQHGDIPNFDFPTKQHFELGEALGLMQFDAAAKLAGSRFTVLRGPLARLERALGQFMIDLHTEQHGYQEAAVPLLVNDATVYGTGQLPKFAEDLFKTTDGRYLIPTAEVPLTNLAANETLPAASLPLRLTALTDCFRSEAGSAGRDTRGMLRQHQFKKVELVSITHPNDSEAEHERMTQCAETVLQALAIPYRKILLCSGDTGFGSTKTYDLEVWLPGQKAWREISSCSNCRDFQGRRMNARYRGSDGKVAGFVHTLNGSGVAVGRALIAVMENYQNIDGSITVPKRLQSYMNNQETIK